MTRKWLVATRTAAVVILGLLLSGGLDLLPSGAFPVASDAGPVAPLDDPDLDGLTNLQEFAAGTDPNNSDTDGGGENDGSEVLLFGQDPLDPADDQIQSIPWVRARPRITSAMLAFGVRAEYKWLRLYRRTTRGLAYTLVNNTVPPTGFYVDSGLVNGLTYYYRLMAVDHEGHRSRVSAAIQASPPGYLRAFLPLVH